jgi:hypothetical protein
MKAWHMLPHDCKLGYDDGRTVRKGETYHVEGDIKMCGPGFHGCVSPVDLLFYAQGCMLARVELFGEVIEKFDKVVASSRKELSNRVNVLPEIVEFAEWCIYRAKKCLKAIEYTRLDHADSPYSECAWQAMYSLQAAEAAYMRIEYNQGKIGYDSVIPKISRVFSIARHTLSAIENAKLADYAGKLGGWPDEQKTQENELNRLFNKAIEERG